MESRRVRARAGVGVCARVSAWAPACANSASACSKPMFDFKDVGQTVVENEHLRLGLGLGPRLYCSSPPSSCRTGCTWGMVWSGGLMTAVASLPSDTGVRLVG